MSAAIRGRLKQRARGHDVKIRAHDVEASDWRPIGMPFDLIITNRHTSRHRFVGYSGNIRIRDGHVVKFNSQKYSCDIK